MVLGSIGTLLLVRFLTEGVHLLPRATTFIDVPIWVLLVTVAAAHHRDLPRRRAFAPFLGPAMIFVWICVLSALLNTSRVAPAPVLLFLYDFLSPLGIFYAVYRLWPVGWGRSFTRLLVVVGLVQLVVVFLFDLPKFLSTKNPDVISGTFGDNQYQLVFYLLVLTGVIATMTIFQRGWRLRRFAPVMLIAIAATIFLAQYRALLLTTLASALLIGWFLRSGTRRGLLVGVLVALTFASSLWAVSSYFPHTKFASTVETFKADPLYFARERLKAGGGVADLYSDRPLTILTGSGPATFSSRAWRTFGDLRATRTAVAASFAGRFTGGEYHTDVADKYVIPRYQNGAVIQGSYAVTWPWSSYYSLLAEVGIAGCLLLIGIYVAAMLHAGRLAREAIRSALPDDPLPALLVGAAVAFFVLLQLAALENWLEVTRITFLSWALLAVGTKELEARREGSSA